MVRPQHLLGRAGRDHAAVLEQHRALAQPLDRARVVGDEHDRPAAALEVTDPAVALLREGLVADREHLVEQQDVRLDVHRHREPEPQYMPDEYVLTGWSTNPSSSANATISARCSSMSAREMPNIAAFRYTFSRPREVGVEAGAELEQRADAPLDRDRALARRVDAGDELQQRRLAASRSGRRSPNDSPGSDVDVDVAQRPQLSPRARRRVISTSFSERAAGRAARSAGPGRGRGSRRASAPTGLRARRQDGPRGGGAPTARVPAAAGPTTAM